MAQLFLSIYISISAFSDSFQNVMIKIEPKLFLRLRLNDFASLNLSTNCLNFFSYYILATGSFDIPLFIFYSPLGWYLALVHLASQAIIYCP